MTKLTDEAKAQNELNKKKQKVEDKQAQWTSPEQMRKDGGEIHPAQKVNPSQPDPENNPEYANTPYDGNGGKGE